MCNLILVLNTTFLHITKIKGVWGYSSTDQKEVRFINSNIQQENTNIEKPPSNRNTYSCSQNVTKGTFKGNIEISPLSRLIQSVDNGESENLFRTPLLNRPENGFLKRSIFTKHKRSRNFLS